MSIDGHTQISHTGQDVVSTFSMYRSLPAVISLKPTGTLPFWVLPVPFLDTVNCHQKSTVPLNAHLKLRQSSSIVHM